MLGANELMVLGSICGTAPLLGVLLVAEILGAVLVIGVGAGAGTGAVVLPPLGLSASSIAAMAAANSASSRS